MNLFYFLKITNTRRKKWKDTKKGRSGSDEERRNKRKGICGIVRHLPFWTLYYKKQTPVSISGTESERVRLDQIEATDFSCFIFVSEAELYDWRSSHWKNLPNLVIKLSSSQSPLQTSLHFRGTQLFAKSTSKNKQINLIYYRYEDAALFCCLI
jgi:hypothetical protein